jgi:uncharacterized protein (TIGR01777 family)
MNVLVTGSTGLVGSALVRQLTAAGHQVTRLVRTASPSGAGEASWDPTANRIATPALEGLDAVVHLAGENISTGRWTPAKKARIRDSREKGTQLLCEALAQLVEAPKVLVSASAIGYYGDRGDQVMREESRPGSDFLAEVCQAWEAATQAAEERGIRVVLLRFGVILSPDGGALAKMLTPFKLGAGGVIGSGQQYMSWVAIDDVVGIIEHALQTDALRGPANAVAPHAVRNHEFAKTLGRVLRRPTVVPMPAPAVRLLFGEMGDTLLLSSTHVVPARLEASGYAFRHPDLEGALRYLLHKE